MLSVKYKLELIYRLTERLRNSYDPEHPMDDELKRERALNELIDSWKDVNIDGDFIVNSRTVSQKVYDL
jgi:hypothetical protein